MTFQLFQIEEDHSPIDLPRPGSGGPVSNTVLQAEAAKRNQMQVCAILKENYKK